MSELATTRGHSLVAQRDEFSANERRLSAERSAIVLAARAKAEVEARFIYAERHPRDWDDVRVRLLADCDRYDFAKAARYKVPNRGEGFTIRFVERTLDLMGNIYAPSYIIYEDDEVRTIRATVIDLERNVTWERDFAVSKTVERQDPSGREVIRYRTKADGGTIAIVRATDEELLSKEASATSKTQRTNGQRIIPPGLLEEAKALIQATLNRKAEEDPEGERKAIADAFASIGVLPSHLKEYLGCELAQLAPAEITGLRELYVAIRDGHTTWREIMAEKRGTTPEVEDKSTGTPNRTTALKEKIKRSSTRQKATDVTGGASSVPGDASGSTGTPTTEASGKPTVPAHITLLESYRAKLTPMAFGIILQKARDGYPEGFREPADVPADVAEQIIFDLEDWIKENGKA